MQSDAGRDRRSHFRIEARIPVRVTYLTHEQALCLATEIQAEPDDPEEIADPVLARWLVALDRKLELILAHLDARHPDPLGSEHARRISLSGSGIGLELDEPVSEDEVVLVELLLPGTPNRSVRALGRPVREAPADGSSKPSACALAFEVISESDRDAIVRFSHEIQRKSLRERSQERDPR